MNANKRYLFLPDLHIPDQDKEAVALVLRFIEDFKPHVIYLIGDQVNFTSMSKFDPDPHYHSEVVDEIGEVKGFLSDLMVVAKRANKNISVVWFDGNHEQRLLKYLGRNAASLADLNIDDEFLVSIPHILGLKKLGIIYIPYGEVVELHGVTITHGMLARCKSGYTGQASIDKYGTSGISGHSHRISFTTRTRLGKTVWWIEAGCLCKLSPTPAYTTYPDWSQGFAVAVYDAKAQQLYGTQIPIMEHSFRFNKKTYK